MRHSRVLVVSLTLMLLAAVVLGFMLRANPVSVEAIEPALLRD